MPKIIAVKSENAKRVAPYLVKNSISQVSRAVSNGTTLVRYPDTARLQYEKDNAEIVNDSDDESIISDNDKSPYTTIYSEMDESNDSEHFNHVRTVSSLTRQEIYMSFLLLQVRGHMSNDVFSDFCRVANCINLALPDSQFFTTYDLFVKETGIRFPPIIRYLYTKCGVSQPLLDLHTKVCCAKEKCLVCTNPITCKKESYSPSKLFNTSAFFSAITVSDWLHELLPKLFHHMDFNRCPNKSIKDITDGSVYRRLTQHGKDMAERNNDRDSKTIHIILGYDGANYTADQSKSIWPIVGWFVEISKELRHRFPMMFSLHSCM